MSDLIALDLGLFPSVSTECAILYQEKKEKLLFEFNRSLDKDTVSQEMSDGVAYTIVYDLHRWHIALLGTMLELKDYEILVQSLPWEYRTYHNQGLPYDYFLHSYRSWQSAIDLTFEKECAKQLGAIYEWLAVQHDKIVESSKVEVKVKSSKIPEHELETLVQGLLDGEYDEVMRLCEQFIAQGNSISALFTMLIHPALVTVGELWENAEITSAREHLATAVVTKTLSSLEAKEPMLTPFRGTAVVTAAQNEYHELAAMVVARALESDGWKVHYLGADIPANDLIALLKETVPKVLAISAVVPFRLDEIRLLIKEIKSDATLRHIKVMIGGRAFDMSPAISYSIGADAYLHDADEAVTKAREWQ